jgi:hypothetical protein
MRSFAALRMTERNSGFLAPSVVSQRLGVAQLDIGRGFVTPLCSLTVSHALEAASLT